MRKIDKQDLPAEVLGKIMEFTRATWYTPKEIVDMEDGKLLAVHVVSPILPCAVGFFSIDGEPIRKSDPRHPGWDAGEVVSELVHAGETEKYSWRW